MRILEYLKPDNQIALWIVYVLLGLFVFWLCLLLRRFWQHSRHRRQIKASEDVGVLRNAMSRASEAPLSLPEEGEEAFRDFLLARGFSAHNPISRHLRAIFDAGWNESQLDVRGLVKNTTDALFRGNVFHRSLLSIFIVLGLLGTLFGISDTLASLDTLLHSSTELSNDALSKGLRQLLGTLKGAFAPSIWGVSLTVVGVLLFAVYLRFVAFPLGNLLERMTLTVWVPQLVHTSAQKLLDKLQLSEQQMQRSFAAAQDVAKFAEKIQHKTGKFSSTLTDANTALLKMEEVADNLTTFSQNFIAGVENLEPYHKSLQNIHRQMLDESRVFQESVKSNIAGTQDFQQNIQRQINSQHGQLVQVLSALQSYEAAYIVSRGKIDEQLSAVLAQAELAFKNLSVRNEEIVQSLDQALGQPLRQNLAQSLGAVEEALQTRLKNVEGALEVHLRSLGDRLHNLDAPLNSAATKFTDTFSNFNEYTNEWRTTLQQEFFRQNETNQQQLNRLESLSEQLPSLLLQLSASTDSFSASSSSFATHGQQIGQDVNALSNNIVSLSQSVDTLGQQVKTRPEGDGPLTELLAKQTSVLTALMNRIERFGSTRSRSRQAHTQDSDSPGRQSVYTPTKKSWRDRLRSWVTFGRR